MAGMLKLSDKEFRKISMTNIVNNFNGKCKQYGRIKDIVSKEIKFLRTNQEEMLQIKNSVTEMNISGHD